MFVWIGDKRESTNQHGGEQNQRYRRLLVIVVLRRKITDCEIRALLLPSDKVVYQTLHAQDSREARSRQHESNAWLPFSSCGRSSCSSPLPPPS
jgi:hypothetical protein